MKDLVDELFNMLKPVKEPPSLKRWFKTVVRCFSNMLFSVVMAACLPFLAVGFGFMEIVWETLELLDRRRH